MVKLMDQLVRIRERIDLGTVRGRGSKLDIFTSRVKDIDWSKQFQERAGIIVYNKTDRKFYLGIDKKFGGMTDFGGHVRYFVDDVPLKGAIREWLEESLGVFFPFFQIEQFFNSCIVYNNDMLIIFLEMEFPSYQIFDAFNIKKKKKPNREIDYIVIISPEELVKSINNQGKYGLYLPVLELLKEGIKQTPNFLKMLNIDIY